MNQLLIVNSKAHLHDGTDTKPTDLSSIAKGAIGFAELGAHAWLSAKPTKDFMIVLGAGKGHVPFIIPDVPINFKVTKSEPKKGTHFKATVTCKALDKGEQATVTVVLAGKHFNERTNYSAVVKATPFKAMTAAEVATEIAKTYKNQNCEQALDLVAIAADADVIFEDKTSYQDYNIVGENVIITITNQGVKPTGDKAAIDRLADFSRGNKGFQYIDGKHPYELYKGFPEETEDTDYNLYTLEFNVGRASGKQVDETVKQIVRIAVPTSAHSISAIETILGLVAAGAGA